MEYLGKTPSIFYVIHSFDAMYDKKIYKHSLCSLFYTKPPWQSKRTVRLGDYTTYTLIYQDYTHMWEIYYLASFFNSLLARPSRRYPASRFYRIFGDESALSCYSIRNILFEVHLESGIVLKHQTWKVKEGILFFIFTNEIILMQSQFLFFRFY